MWVQRTPEEIRKWHESTQREARSHGRLIAGMVLILVPPVVAGGWLVSFGAGAAVQRNVSGTFWLRWLVLVLVALPFAWFVYRRESRKELAELTSRTICPNCDTGGKGNGGAQCACGGSFVSQSTVKWVDQEPPP